MTLQISHPFHMVPLRIPDGFHWHITGKIIFDCFISTKRGKLVRLLKVGYAMIPLNSVIKVQQWFWKPNMEEQTAEYFVTGIIKCHEDVACRRNDRSQTSLLYLRERTKALNSWKKQSKWLQTRSWWMPLHEKDNYIARQ